MASTSYPAAGGGAVTEAQYERVMRGLPSGLHGAPSDSPMVFADGTGTRVVKILANRRGRVRGFTYDSGASVISMASLAANASGSTRIDRIVLELDRSTWAVTEKVVQGTAGAGAPALTQTDASTGVWQLPMARVTVASGATTLAAGTVIEEGYYVADSGIRCKSTTRPPAVIPGLLMVEDDTGRSYVGVGTTWFLLSDDSGASNISMLSGYTAPTNVMRRRDGLVVLHFEVQRNSSMSANNTFQVGTIPVGFRPGLDVEAVAAYPSASGLSVRFQATPSGSMRVLTPAGLSVNADRPVSGFMTWFV